MKKLSLLAAIFLITSSLGSTAFAEETTTSLKSEAGITPDNILYPIDVAIDNIKLNFQTSSENKAEVLTEIAEERLGESEAMTEEGKTELAEKALNKYTENMDKAIEQVTSAIESTENTNTDEQNNKLQDLQEKIIKKQQNSIDILKSLESKVSDSAKPILAKVIEMQTAKKQAVVAMVQKRHELNTIKKELNVAKTQLEEAKKLGNAESIKKAEELLITKQAAFEQTKTEYKQVFEAKKEATKGGIKANEELKKTIEKEVKDGNISKENAKEIKKNIDSKNDNVQTKDKIKEDNKEKIKDTNTKIKNEVKEDTSKNKPQSKIEEKKENLSKSQISEDKKNDQSNKVIKENNKNSEKDNKNKK